MQEFETATGLHGPETQRPAPGHLGSGGWSGPLLASLPLARELGRLYAALDKLRAILCASTASTRATTPHRCPRDGRSLPGHEEQRDALYRACVDVLAASIRAALERVARRAPRGPSEAERWR